MTSDDIQRLTPLVDRLKTEGLITAYATTSWPVSTSTPNSSGTPVYDHGFLLSFPRLTDRLAVFTPFDEEDLRVRESLFYTRQQHGAAIEATFHQVKEQLIADLAAVYRHRLYGKNLPVPDEITVKEIKVSLATSAAPSASSTVTS